MTTSDENSPRGGPPPDDLTARLRAALAAAAASGTTLYAVAKRAGVSYPVVHRLAAGKRGVSLATAHRLATALGLSLDAAPDDPPPSARLTPAGRTAAARGLLRRAFDGALDQMVASLFAAQPPSPTELDRIEALLAEHRRRQAAGGGDDQ